MAAVKQPTRTIKKRELRHLYSAPVLRAIEDASIHHAGISDIATRLAHHIGNAVTFDGVAIIDIAVSQALSEWSSIVRDLNIQEAYLHFCRSISESLPKVLEFCVSANSSTFPFNRTQWDCFNASYLDWVSEHKIAPASVEIVHTETLSKQEIELGKYILSSRIFRRNELEKMWGLRSEIHRHRRRIA